MKLRYQLPPIYAQWLPADLLNLDPIESKATCDACAMVKGRTRTQKTYEENLKCCTYRPWIPNFFVGEVLLDTSAKYDRAREIFTRQIRERDFALPLGIAPSIGYQVEFYKNHARDFGENPEWLCPYYDQSSNLCSIWQYRGSVCTSFHCKTVHGASGKTFWKQNENYLSYVEVALMEDCLVHLDFSPRQVSDLLDFLNRRKGTKEEKSWERLPAALHRKLWNGYDDPAEFYKKCARHVRGLDKRAFREVLGEMGASLEEEFRHSSLIWSRSRERKTP